MSNNSINNIKVSVIVPVYNPGSYFRRCIDSLLNQTLKDIEIIFVDDCSTDGTIDIIKQEAKNDNRIKLIRNKKNTGSGIARNKGIEIAKGEYLCFVDSDDYVADDFLELLFKKAHKNKLDIVKGTNVYVRKDGTIVDQRSRHNLNRSIRNGLKNNVPLFVLYIYEHHSSLYRKELLDKYNIRYGLSRRSHDNTFLLKVCHRAESFDFEESAKYNFMERDNSAMHSIESKQLKNILDSIVERFDYVITNIKDNRNTEKFTDIVIRTELRNVTYYTNSMESKEAKEYSKGLKEQLNRLPWKDEFVSNIFSYKVLEEYEYALPQTPFVFPWQSINDPFEYIKLIKIWIDFFKKHPEEYRNGELPLSIIIYRAFANCSSYNKDFDTMDKRKAFRLLLKQIKRLNVLQNCRLFLRMIYKYLLNRLKK